MPIQIKAPDGSIAQFPDGMSDEQITAVMRKEFPAPAMSMGDVGSQALQNFPSSALNLGKSIVQPILHPIQAAENLYHLGAGIIEKITGSGGADESTANAVGKYFADRYGGLENVKKTIAFDPAGFMADASVLLGGGGAALKATGTLGKVADAGNAMGHIANPITLGIGAAKGATNLAGKGLAEALGVTTGAGSPSIKAAYGAGVKGGDAAQALAANMRGQVPMESIVDQARGALGQIRSNRGAEYRAGMGSVNSDPTMLSLDPVHQAVADTSSIKNFHGVDLSPSTAATREKIANLLMTWQGGNPAQFRTAEGFDALKQAIGDVRDSTDYGTPARVVADQAYNAVKNEIVKQAPQYGKVMGNYSEASKNIEDIQKTLSLGPNAASDTSIRKLQSALRDNVNTSYGRRTDLANELAANGAPNLIEGIAGQTLASPTTRGIGKMLAQGELGTGAIALGAGHPGVAAAMIPAMALQSPRLVGEGALLAGKAARLAKLLALPKKTAGDAANIARLMGELKNQDQPAMAGSGQ